MVDKVKDWVEAFDEAYMNAVIHGTGFVKVTTNGPGGLQLSVVDPKDYRYLMEEPPEQEPVAWMSRESADRLKHGGNSKGAVPVHAKWSNTSKIPLYTKPQREWVGLTDEEKRSVCRVGPVYAPDGVVTRKPLEYRKELEGVALMAVRQAETKLKEKNT